MPSCWIEVNVDAIRHNLRAVKELIGPTTSVIAVIKANAYGHGACEIARVVAAEGVRALAVTRVEEAVPLRAAGIDTPILLLAPALPDEVATVVELNLTACVASYQDAVLLSEAAAARHTVAAGHLKIDTGMGRLGIDPQHALEVATAVMELPSMRLEAAFTHFAQAGGVARDTAQVHHAYGLFQPLIHHLARAGSLDPAAFHCANSATLLRFPSMRLSCVRFGTLLYGQFPSTLAAEAGHKLHLELHDTFAAKARIVAIQELQAGQAVGYGGEWRAARATRIATLAAGYYEGLTLEPHTRSEAPHLALRHTLRQAAKQAAQWTGLKKGEGQRFVTLHGQPAPIVGRIAMQQCSIDISGIPAAAVGDAATIPMRRTSAASHLPRVYVTDQ